MPVFIYRAADQRGQTVDGVMEAPDARSVVERLQRDAYFPIKVAPQEERAGLAGFTWPTLGQGRVAPRDPRDDGTTSAGRFDRLGDPWL